jgi:DNA-binding GntR family transcriptional regulator
MEARNSVKQNVIFQKLRQMIISGYFRPGESLSEREIADMLNVSRTPVREAFRRLENEGLVVYEPQKGVTISSFTREQVISLYRVREYLEGLAAWSLTENPDRRVLQKMRQKLENARDAARDGDVLRQAEINDEFHELMAKGSKNQYLINMLEPLRSQINFFRSTSLSYQGRPQINIIEHERICDAIASGDPHSAENEARIHVRNSLQAALANLKIYKM